MNIYSNKKRAEDKNKNFKRGKKTLVVRKMKYFVETIVVNDNSQPEKKFFLQEFLKGFLVSVVQLVKDNSWKDKYLPYNGYLLVYLMCDGIFFCVFADNIAVKNDLISPFLYFWNSFELHLLNNNKENKSFSLFNFNRFDALKIIIKEENV